ncbi:3-oxoadipate enol-lactonase [Marivita sp. GX14005]|uniref:3-oxoadipate enol-lactonase n=1 Tax=Marivita sp. GX14005 TaxID=2942276 RepID=UPI0020186AFB|nr:3-oxoadipate enol-lactonase [Marivita sp. GX14005]MCL3880982.1 3-oxoadipate enol-lactonase [Marivita sp. GX14005]
MKMASLGNIHLHYRIDGDPNGAPVVFGNALGTDLRLWDALLERMPDTGWRYIRYDMRGHGLSDCPSEPYAMGAMIRDAELLMEYLDVKDAVFVGQSVGGLIAQGLAAKRLDLVRAMVLANTAARFGNRDVWSERIETAKRGGLEALVDATMQRWFPATFRETDAFHAWRNMFLNMPVDGYIGYCHAISGTDFFTTTAALRLPTLGIAGSEDGSTPPDMVRETTALVPGSRFELIRKTGHVPCVDAPDAYAEMLRDFLSSLAH